MTPRPGASRRSERGAALLMTLLLVAALSTVAVAMSEALSISARRSANAEARDQALWHVVGAEEMARQILRRDFEASPDRTTLEAPWAQGVVTFPTDAGRIEVVLLDRANCFNVNSLGAPEERRGYAVNPVARQELRTLAQALEASDDEAERLAAAAGDWIDFDESPSGRGAEDFDYSVLEPPYRTGNTLFAEVEEVRSLSGADEPLFRTLRPLLCAYPDTNPAQLNVNTLRPEDAPLLTALFAGELSVEAAEDVIAARPPGGWASAADFWAVEAVAAIAVDDAVRARVGLTTMFFELRTRVYHGTAYVEAASLLRRNGGAVSVVRRRLGGGE